MAELCSYGGKKCFEEKWEKSTDGMCIFHSHNNASDPEAVRHVWHTAREMCSAKTIVFTGWHFPENDSGFMGITFNGFTDFTHACFAGTAKFLNAVFRERSDFADCIFKGHARLRHVRFENRASFAKANFNSNTEFGGTTFVSAADFDAAKFKEDFGFDGVRCSDDISFARTVFRHHVHFDGTVFERSVSFEDASFHNISKFRDMNVGGQLVLTGTRFMGPAYFEGMKIIGGASSVIGADANIRKSMKL